MQYGDPRRSFRRGLFLGLTTAEISILLVFVLLLLFTESSLSEPEEADQPPPGASIDEIWLQSRAAIRDAERQVQAAREEIENWRELTRDTATRNKELKAELEAKRAEATTAAQNAAMLETTITELNAEAARTGRENREVREELEQALARAERAERTAAQAGTGPGGTGSDHPSCWYDDDGDVEYVWDVALHERGFLLRPGPAPVNGHRRVSLPINDTTTGRYVTPSEFVAQTKPLYDWSVARRCRFFVRAFDDTPATAKGLYIRRMRVLEGHFYKNPNPSGPPPRP